MLNEGTSIQASICVSVRLMEGEHERPIQSFYGLKTLFCVTDMIVQSLPACQNTYNTCKNEDLKCLSFLELWNGWWANQCCSLMCFVKRKKGSGSVGGFSSVRTARGRDVFSALLLALSAVLVKVPLFLVLVHIACRSENLFYHVKVCLDYRKIECGFSVCAYKRFNRIKYARHNKDKHLASFLLIFTHFHLKSKV